MRLEGIMSIIDALDLIKACAFEAGKTFVTDEGVLICIQEPDHAVLHFGDRTFDLKRQGDLQSPR